MIPLLLWTSRYGAVRPAILCCMSISPTTTSYCRRSFHDRTMFCLQHFTGKSTTIHMIGTCINLRFEHIQVAHSSLAIQASYQICFRLPDTTNSRFALPLPTYE